MIFHNCIVGRQSLSCLYSYSISRNKQINSRHRSRCRDKGDVYYHSSFTYDRTRSFLDISTVNEDAPSCQMSFSNSDKFSKTKINCKREISIILNPIHLFKGLEI